MTEVSSYQMSYTTKWMDALKEEITLLQTWFRREYPESTLRVEMDLNKITMELSLKIRVLMGKEIADNQGFFESDIRIPEKKFWNEGFMSPFIKMFNEQLRKNISISVNNHYANEKNKGTRHESL